MSATIQVKETVKNKVTRIKATLPNKTPIDIETFFMPYYNKGLRIKKLIYVINSGKLTADMVAKS
ncbi:hypothetical protein [Algibacter sp. PT7-4]|uniref:hypothetical protein n=1 Tax=Algibacter ulvanivorans TaxID=3400999 RepID=UPI003AACD2FF